MTAMPYPEPPLVRACTISRDVQNFDLLIEDMETAMGEAWGDLGFEEVAPFLIQPEAKALEFIALAIDAADEDILQLLGNVITAAKAKKIKVILIAEDVTPATLHALLRKGADEFIPYPLPEGELARAIERMGKLSLAPEPAPATPTATRRSGLKRDGALIVVHGLAGGTGATTLAVNLGWELATIAKTNAPSVCLLDLDLQYGSVSTFLDLPRRELIYDMLSDTERMDEEIFTQALLSYGEKLHVLTAPADMLPLDLITPEDVTRVLDMARSQFDYVLVDMPSTLVHWSETVLSAAHIYLATLELDMRSAQNTLRFKRALLAEELPVEKLRFVMNRAPRFTDLTSKSRVKRMAESLGISIDLQLPDGGRLITQANDHGQPLAVNAAKNPLRREIAKLAASIHSHRDDAAEAA